MRKLKNISSQGYKKNSPDRNRSFNTIPTGRITMKDVPHIVVGIDNLGNTSMMMPGHEYQFPGSYVTEFPMKKNNEYFHKGGEMSDEDMNSTNKKYFLERLEQVGLDSAVREYISFFGRGNKKRYSIK